MAKTPKTAHILVVDDDPDILLTVRIVLKPYAKKIQTEDNPHQIEKVLGEQSFDLILLDMNFTRGFTSGKEGLRWLKKIRKMAPQTPVVMMTAYGEVHLAVKAMKEGAQNFILKPWDNDELIQTLEEALHPTSASPPPPKIASNNASDGPQIIGHSAAMQTVFRLVQKVAPTDANVLILGENGTGKELIARALHHQSQRAKGPFVHVDLGAISENLFESELFGHVKGAFTDARETRIGRFEAAAGGTLFLDEIGNLSLPLQAKLLTALQSRTISKVGSHTPISLDIRLICATNIPILEHVQNRQFRQDLLYRINTVEVTLPPLRERPDDIPHLVQYFLEIYAKKYSRVPMVLEEAVLQHMQQYDWPGNIRELQHLVERAMIMEDSQILMPVLPTQPVPAPPTAQTQVLDMESVEKETIQRAIARNEGNISKAAKELGLGRTTLYRKMTKYGLF